MSELVAVLDWRELAPPPEHHVCDCGYCEMGGNLEPTRWPALVPLTAKGTDYVTDKYLAIRADLAPVPDGYEGHVFAGGVGSATAPDAWLRGVTDSPPTDQHFRWQIIKAIETTGWRLRLIEGAPTAHPDGRVQLVAVVTADGEDIGWAVAARYPNDNEWDGNYTRPYVEPS